jgi:DNA-directed RNA polymerase specialized sigma subunit
MRVRGYEYDATVNCRPDQPKGRADPHAVLAAVGAWNDDLMRLRSGELSFDAFAKRHMGIVRRLASRWGRRCPERFGVDDASQEALLEIWRSVDCWDATRGIPLHAFVRQRVRFRLLGMTDRLLKGRDVETRYLWAVGRRDDTVSDRSPLLDERVGATRRLANVVGTLDPTSAEVVMAVVSGRQLGDIRQEVYSQRTAGGAVKKARSVLRDASQLAAQF